jgi:D-alanine-D-alanine ligase-like ATP-grasp enzyme
MHFIGDYKTGWLIKMVRRKYRIQKKWEEITCSQKDVYVWHRVPFYKQMWQEAARELSAEFIELAEGIWEVRYRDRLTRICMHKVQLDDPVISTIAGNKPLCYAEMMKNNIPVPIFMTFRLKELAGVQEFMKKQKGFFVVKPANGTSAGMGITTHIRSFHECSRAAALASLYCSEMLIESFVPGESYRFLVLNGELIHVVRRRGLRVRGDGQSTIGQLLEDLRTLRGSQWAHYPKRADRDLEAMLQAQRLSMQAVPRDGRNILVRSTVFSSASTVEVRTVYDEDVTALICDDLRAQAERVAQIFSSRFTGVDIITVDPTVSLEKSGGVVTEVNTNPGLHHHYDLMSNGGARPAVNVLGHLLDITAP